MIEWGESWRLRESGAIHVTGSEYRNGRFESHGYTFGQAGCDCGKRHDPPPTPAGQRNAYILLGEREEWAIPASIRARVDLAVAMAASDMKIETPFVSWFRSATSEEQAMGLRLTFGYDVNGFTLPTNTRAVYLSARPRPLAAVVQTALHETRHIGQVVLKLVGNSDREHDARRWASEFLRKHAFLAN